MPLFHAFLRDEKAATAVEYALIAGIVSIVIVASTSSVATTLFAVFQSVLAGFN
jgi:pilus assembly protein Flp/PilA